MRNYLTGLRKFALALLCLIGGFWLVLNGKDVGALTGYVAVVLGFYSGANVMQYYTNQRYGKGKEPNGDSSENN